MFALPLIAPPADESWHNSIYLPRADSPPPAANAHTTHAQQSSQHRQQRQQREEEKRLLQTRSPLALLAQDEAAIAARKAAIRNFGAYWLRPPGISKTLQAMIEEDVERREQEELERQEQGLRDLQAQQQLEEAQQRAAETAAEQEAGEGGEEERNLDDDVPEAGEHDMTFNEDSMLEDSHVVDEEHEQAALYEELEEAELLGVAREEENLGIDHERDLDDSVPEAASFMHDESGADEDTSESGIHDTFALPAAPRARGALEAAGQADAGGLFGRTRMLQRSLNPGLPRSPGSMILSSPQIESSFAASSPVRQRGARAAVGRNTSRSQAERQNQRSPP